MSELARGKPHTPALLTQARDFSGLRYGKITPTDVDAFIDFGDRLFVFIEAKLPNIELLRGQQLALERVTAASASARRYAVAIVCEHHNRSGVIDFATCRVLRVYWQTGDKWEWRVPAIIGLTVRGVIDRLLLHYQLGCYLKRDDAA